jgi:N-formylglutamate amidohydrolase
MYPEPLLPIVAHIPHAGTHVPSRVRDQFTVLKGELWREIAMVTDWYTNEIYGMPGIAINQTPISRVVTDLERYIDDEREPQARVGQGVIYSHNMLGEKIRRDLSVLERCSLLANYYHPWHLKLELDIEQQLNRWGNCLLLDCHSFPNDPPENQEKYLIPPPNICLGVDEANTPEWLIESCRELLLRRGYSVSVNFPYAGCLIPNRFQGNPRVPAIMLEINRRLYLKPAGRDVYRLGDVPVKLTAFEHLRNDIWSIMLLLAQEMQCRARAVNPICRY